MIKELKVTNFAIIEDIDVKFNDKFTTLTGETGAGKSLLIDTISLLLGERSNSDMIRFGKEYATVCGIFSHNHNLDYLFNSLNIKINDEIKIYREIHNNSRNIIKVNDTNVTLLQLKMISIYIASIHVQNDTYKLFNVDSYLSFIDPLTDDKFEKIMNKYSKDLYNYLNQYDVYDKIIKSNKNREERLDFLKYEKNELESLNLYVGCDKELEDKIQILSNFDKIKNNLIEAYNNLNELPIIDNLYNSATNLNKIEEYDSKYKEYSEKIYDSYYILEDIKNNISKDINNLDYDEDELNFSIERLNEITKAKDKYKKNVEELIKYLNDITLEISLSENYDDVLKENKNKLIDEYNKLKDSSIKLTEYRKKISKELEKKLIKECNDLDLDDTNFEIRFNNIDYNDPFDKSIFNQNGVDIINFYVSFNKGEPVKELSKVASGGELSRVMLAFKAALADDLKCDLMIFDEIDTGVSGVTALKIAKKMNEISKKNQVLAITHLPQVAAFGDYHKHISKEIENGRTHTIINDLIGDLRIEEIARMLSGDRISVTALNHAKELLENK